MISNRALQACKRLFFAAKAGHTGSLDPLATGTLPLCFGEATKFAQYLLTSDKCYEAAIVLGYESDTQDADGAIEPVASARDLSEQAIGQAVAVLRGEQKQIPPPYRPRLESERDLANFPPEFTEEPVQLTPDDQ